MIDRRNLPPLIRNQQTYRWVQRPNRRIEAVSTKYSRKEPPPASQLDIIMKAAVCRYEAAVPRTQHMELWADGQMVSSIIWLQILVGCGFYGATLDDESRFQLLRNLSWDRDSGRRHAWSCR